MPRLLLIGQAPSRTSDPEKPLEGEPLASKLCELFGCTREEYLKKTERHNILTYWPGKGKKGDLVPWLDMLRGADRLRAMMPGRRVLFIGKGTAEAFHFFDEPIMTWLRQYDDQTMRWHRIAILPHPSGINRWWNEIVNRRRALQFMRKAWQTCVR